MTAWKTLIKRYADGKIVCNCGEAYYSLCGRGGVWQDGDWVQRNDLLACEHGCSSNQLSAKEYVAKCVLSELNIDSTTK